jgi:hypothetical protein
MTYDAAAAPVQPVNWAGISESAPLGGGIIGWLANPLPVQAARPASLAAAARTRLVRTVAFPLRLASYIS